MLAIVTVETRFGLRRSPWLLAVIVTTTRSGPCCSLVAIDGRGKLQSRIVAMPLPLQSVDGQAKLATMVERRGQIWMSNESTASDEGGLAWVDRKQYRKGWRWRLDEWWSVMGEEASAAMNDKQIHEGKWVLEEDRKIKILSFVSPQPTHVNLLLK